jgi:hypothetical protein
VDQGLLKGKIMSEWTREVLAMKYNAAVRAIANRLAFELEEGILDADVDSSDLYNASYRWAGKYVGRHGAAYVLAEASTPDAYLDSGYAPGSISERDQAIQAMAEEIMERT